ncbi:unnamed protein product (macronuclear) [Paramecium tetraurelia]|uniref:Uncharacterized protein n=1 Tax=Paramecium tetraurelia TaxID=5888 RepID=A0DWH4_PARTE|nr:uncharacterized protein GSPATT00021033001 [Paramecium tetraurelia]CAK87391.1 unnamed protein product [Paramecium tetraurelia]|eukprot:XP_001454788.1 hypothetical protein (macronuclear) [Paramecium tetraurelia strain d4-2]
MNQMDGLIEENTQLKKAIISSKAVISRKINEFETLQAINDELKQHIDKLKLDNNELNQKLRIALHEKKQTEQQFDNASKSWKLLIEQKQRELEEIQSKLSPSFDQDMIRIKLLNELEIPHRQQLEVKQNEIEKLNEVIYQLKRNLDLEIAKVETTKLENAKEIKLIQERFKLDNSDLQHQIEELTKIIEDSKDRDLIRRLRKDLDEYKLKFNNADTENVELRNERDKIREEKNEIMIKFARQIDQERNDKRQYKSDFDKIQVRTRFIEDELRKEKQRREQLSTNFEIMKTEKDQLLTEIRKKDDTIHYLQRKIGDMEEEQLEQEQKVQDKLTRLYQDEHDKYLQERNKAVTLQKDLDNLKKRFSDLQDDYKILKDRYQKDNTDNKDNSKTQNEEIEKLKKIVSQQLKDIGDLERSNKNREEQIHDIENENETLKRRNRELQHRIQLIEVNPLPSPQQQTQMIFNQSQYPSFAQSPQYVQQIQDQYETKPKQNTAAQSENEPQNQTQAQKQTLQQITEENRTLIQKNKKLSKKLKEANDKILELSMKNTLLEKQIQRQHSVPQYSNQEYQGNYTHSQSPLRYNYENYDQQDTRQAQQTHTDTRLDRFDKSDRYGQPNQDKYRSRNQSGMNQQYNQGHYNQIHEDDLLNKVMMLTNNNTGQTKYW